MGLNEAAGYLAVAATALGHRLARRALRAAARCRSCLGLVFAALGLGLSAVVVRETRRPCPARGRAPTSRGTTTSRRDSPGGRSSCSPASGRRRCRRPARPAWSTTSTTGSPGACTRSCSPPPDSASPASAFWSRSTPPSGASARCSPAGCRTGGAASGSSPPACCVQAVGIALVAAANGFAAWAVAAVLMGAGTAMVYPTLLAVIGDVAHPAWRARAVGVYRLWRDIGYAVGALTAGVTADAVRPARRDLARRRPHRRIRRGRRGAHVRNLSPRAAGPGGADGGLTGIDMRRSGAGYPGMYR